jgi:hypothetical protein
MRRKGVITLRKTILAVIFAVGFTAIPVAATAAPNPSGSGQPSQECGAAGATSSPSGFATGGFATAEGHYAGSDGTPSLANGSGSAVSQYDVACYQVTQAGH